MPRILLMEDNEHQALLFSEWLEAEGYSVSLARNLDQAIELLKEPLQIDLVITDIFVPRSDHSREIERGLTLIRHIRSSGSADISALPIISISGVRIERSYAYRFDDPHTFGANVHLAKPINFGILSKTIDKFIGQSPENSLPHIQSLAS